MAHEHLSVFYCYWRY